MKLSKKYFLTSLLISAQLFSQEIKTYNAAEIKLKLKKLSVAASMLYIAAHPDDENTRLLTYFANEKLWNATYLSLTRGDGGQNLIGTEQSEQLGLIRTQELLAARGIDGAEQLFTRANDFGFSKNPEETMKIWDKEKILADVVWAIRKTKPDIIICRFPTNGDGGHGHHTASALLAEEAYTAAADPTKFPEQLKYVSVWKAKRLFWNAFVRDPKTTDVSKFLKLDVGVFNSTLGKSYGEISADSRTMHKSQGFGSSKTRGQQWEYFQRLKGDSVKLDILENINSRFSSYGTSKLYNESIDFATLEFNPENPQKTIERLITAYSELDKITDTFWKNQKKKEIQELIFACAGIYAEALSSEYYSAPESKVKTTLNFICRNNVTVSLDKISFPFGVDSTTNKSIQSNVLNTFDKEITIPANAEYTNPYWLNEPTVHGIYNVSDQEKIGVPQNKASCFITLSLKINGNSFTINLPVKYKWTDPVDGERYRPFAIVPPVSVRLSEKNYIITDTKEKTVKVFVTAFKQNAKGIVKLALPQGWKSSPEKINFEIASKYEEAVYEFKLTPPTNFERTSLKAIAEMDGKEYSKFVKEIKHNHIPAQTIIYESEADLVSVNISNKVKNIGYLEGAGDDVAECIQQIGIQVTELSDKDFTGNSLSKFDAIVIGIRAYNTKEKMKSYQKYLMDYVKNGGTLVVQYNTNNFLGSINFSLGPYPFKVSRDRVTVEEAPVTFVEPSHPLLQSPNKITDKDFEGWIQERGIYFASDWDKNYETIISMNDPSEKVSEGSVIYCKYGKGNFVYTGLSFFRELPAGVPGAYRLLVNMMNAGK